MSEDFKRWFKGRFDREPDISDSPDCFMWDAWCASREALDVPYKQSALTDRIFGD